MSRLADLFKQDLFVVRLFAALAARRDRAEEDSEQREEESAPDQARTHKFELKCSKALITETDEGDHLKKLSRFVNAKIIFVMVKTRQLITEWIT